jgi:hypothetical protein
MESEQHIGCQPWSDPHMNVGFVIRFFGGSMIFFPLPETLDLNSVSTQEKESVL